MPKCNGCGKKIHIEHDLRCVTCRRYLCSECNQGPCKKCKESVLRDRDSSPQRAKPAPICHLIVSVPDDGEMTFYYRDDEDLTFLERILLSKLETLNSDLDAGLMSGILNILLAHTDGAALSEYAKDIEKLLVDANHSPTSEVDVGHWHQIFRNEVSKESYRVYAVFDSRM